MRINTLNFAEDYGLDIIEITEGNNGYPKNIYKGVIGFNNFMSAIEFADIINGEVVLLSRKEGQHFYTNNGWVDKPIHYTKLIDDSVIDFSDINDFKKYILNVLKENFKTFDDCEEFISNVNSINDFIDNYDYVVNNNLDKKFIILYDSNRKIPFAIDVVSEYVMKGSFDTTNYIIGVVENEDDTIF